MYYKGKLKKLKDFNFKLNTNNGNIEYIFNDNEQDMQIIIDTNRTIYISTTDSVFVNAPDIILDLYDNDLINMGVRPRQIKNNDYKIERLPNNNIDILYEKDNYFFKKKKNVKLFLYRGHSFFIDGCISTYYIIGDVLTGCYLDYTISHISELDHLKANNKLDKHLQDIILNKEKYSKAISRLKNAILIK